MHATAVQIETPREGRFSWSGLLRLVGLVCMGVSWLMPNHYLPWYAFHSDAMALMAVFAWSLSVAVEHVGPAAVPRLAVIVLLVIAIPWIQFALGLLGFAGEAWLATLYLSGFAAAICIGFRWARRSQAEDILLQTVIAAVLVAGLISTGLCLFQWLRLEDWLGIFIANIGETGRPFGNIAQPNLLATLLVMSLVALAWTYESRRIGSGAALCAAVFLTLGLSFTQSRAGYLSAAAVALWWIAKHGQVEARRMNRWWPLAWLLLLACFAAILPKLSIALDLAGDRTVPLFDNNGRWLMWKQIAYGIMQSPWVGYGWEHTPSAQMAGAIRYPGVLATGYAHNIVLDAIAWLGIPLGLAACTAGALWLFSRARQARGRLPVFAFAVMLPVLVHSMFEFPFAYAVFLLPAGIMIGLIEASRSRPSVVMAPSALVIGLTLVVGAVGLQIAREYIPAEEDFRFLRFEALRMGNTPQSHSRPQFVLLTHLDALLDVGRITPAPDMSLEQIERLRFVTAKYAWAPPAFLYAAVLEANGFGAQSAHQMDVIHGMYGANYYAGALARMEELRTQWRERRSAPHS
jgi:hypothetical protein